MEDPATKHDLEQIKVSLDEQFGYVFEKLDKGFGDVTAKLESIATKLDDRMMLEHRVERLARVIRDFHNVDV